MGLHAKGPLLDVHDIPSHQFVDKGKKMGDSRKKENTKREETCVCVL
jgi:hypothetical protein